MKKNWINCGKTIAIIAVLIDHMNGTLYTNQTFAWLSYYSVTLFVLLSGVTSYYSNSNHVNSHEFSEIARRVLHIIKPYTVATALYLILINHSFSFNNFITYLLDFNIIAPFYFVAFYIQLIIISPFLFKVINKINRNRYALAFNICILLILFFISYLSIKYTFMFELHGGGRYLFGGTYLPVFYLGMLFAHWNPSYKSKQQNAISILISSILLVIWFVFINHNKLSFDLLLPFGNGFNPPSMSLIIYSVLMFVCIFSIVSFEKYITNKAFTTVIKVISEVGNYSLYIFLYHIFIYTILYNISLFSLNIWVKRFVYMSAMIILPILVKKLYDRFLVWLKQPNTN